LGCSIDEAAPSIDFSRNSRGSGGRIAFVIEISKFYSIKLPQSSAAAATALRISVGGEAGDDRIGGDRFAHIVKRIRDVGDQSGSSLAARPDALKKPLRAPPLASSALTRSDGVSLLLPMTIIIESPSLVDEDGSVRMDVVTVSKSGSGV
jgi:hypothetical protein